MSSWKLVTIAILSGLIGGGVSSVLLLAGVQASDEIKNTLTIDTLNVESINLTGQLRIPATDPLQESPDLLINRTGLFNVVRIADKKDGSAWIMQLSPTEGLRFNTFQNSNYLSPTFQSRFNAVQLTQQTGRAENPTGYDLISIAGHTISVSTSFGALSKEKSSSLSDTGVLCKGPDAGQGKCG